MKTRSLTEGAMLGAVTVLLTIVGEYIGISALVVPVPLILLVYRQGLQLGILTAVAASLIASLVAGHVFSGLSILIWGFLGIALGMALRERFSFGKTFAVGILANIVITGLSVLLYFSLFGKSMFGELLETLTLGIEQAVAVWESLGVTGEALTRYEQLLEMAPVFMKWGLPALLLISAAVMTYINLAVVRLVLKRMGDSIPWVPPFTNWQIPSYFAILLLAGVFLARLAEIVAMPTMVQIVGLNLFLLFFPVYLILGIAIVWYYFNQKNIASVWRVFFIFLLFSLEPLVLIVVLLGISDSLFDFRRLQSKKKN